MHIEINNELKMEFQSDLKPIFFAIKDYCKNLVWLISYHEFQYMDSSIDERLKPLQEIIKIDGADLIEIIEKYRIQFTSGVLSGCKTLAGIENIDLEKTTAENYDPEEYLLADALIEIDCFDSSSTIIKCRDKNILDVLSAYFQTEIRCIK